MSTQTITHRRPVPSEAIPQQGGRPLADRLIRQVEAIDAWNTTRRRRESLLQASGRSRLEQETARYQVAGLRRTQQAIEACAAGELARDPGPLLLPTATAVVVHRHRWFAEKLVGLLAARGVTVLACTDNGVDALGVIVAEQPDVVLAGDRLAMLPGHVLLAESRLFAPATARAVHANERQPSDHRPVDADVVFLRHNAPEDIADALTALCRAPALEGSRV